MLSDTPEVHPSAVGAPIDEALSAQPTEPLAFPSTGRRRPAYENLCHASDKEIERALYRLGFILEFVNLGRPRGLLGHYAGLHAVRAGIKLEQMPALSTLYTWSSEYTQHGLVGLIDVPRSRGRFPSVSPAAMSVIKEALCSGCWRIADIHRLLLRRLDPQDVPGYGTVRRICLTDTARHLMIGGQGRSYPIAVQAEPELAPGDVHEIDAVVLRAWLQVPESEVMEGCIATCPVLTMVTDRATRVVLTFALVCRLGNEAQLLSTYEQAIVTGRNHPGLPTVELPREIVLDHRDEGASPLRRVLAPWGVRIRHREPGSCAATERLFHRIEREVLASMPGYVGMMTPGSDLPKPEFLFSAEEVEERLLAWAVAHNRAIQRTKRSA